jgi:hypothetical protein
MNRAWEALAMFDVVVVWFLVLMGTGDLLCILETDDWFSDPMNTVGFIIMNIPWISYLVWRESMRRNAIRRYRLRR